MKILVITTNDRESNTILEGWKNALEALKHEVIETNSSTLIFRLLEQNKPDLLITGISNVNRSLGKAITEFGTKTIVWTDREPEKHESLNGIIWASFNPQLAIAPLEYVPVGFDEIKFQKNNNETKKYQAICISRNLSSDEENYVRRNRLPVFSESAKKLPNYVGALTANSTSYAQIDTAYVLDGYADLGNLQACGAQIKTSLDEGIDFVPPYDSYVNIMQKLLEKIS